MTAIVTKNAKIVTMTFAQHANTKRSQTKVFQEINIPE